MPENLKRTDLINAIEETRKSFDTDNPTVPFIEGDGIGIDIWPCLLYTSPSPRDTIRSRMPSSA